MGLLVSNCASPCNCNGGGIKPFCDSFYGGAFNLSLENPSGHWQATAEPPSPITNPPINCQPTLEITWPQQATPIPIIPGVQAAYFLVGLSGYNSPWSYGWAFSITYDGTLIFSVNGQTDAPALLTNLSIYAVTDTVNWVWSGQTPPDVQDNNQGAWTWSYFGAPSAAQYPLLLLDLQVSGPPGASMGGGLLSYFTSQFKLAMARQRIRVPLIGKAL